MTTIRKTKYKILDNRTGRIVSGYYNSRNTAHLKADRLDNQYGAYRYTVVRC